MVRVTESKLGPPLCLHRAEAHDVEWQVSTRDSAVQGLLGMKHGCHTGMKLLLELVGRGQGCR